MLHYIYGHTLYHCTEEDPWIEKRLPIVTLLQLKAQGTATLSEYLLVCATLKKQLNKFNWSCVYS